MYQSKRLIQVRVDLGEMAMKGYSQFLKTPELEFHYQTPFSVIPKTIFVFVVFPRFWYRDLSLLYRVFQKIDIIANSAQYQW